MWFGYFAQPRSEIRGTEIACRRRLLDDPLGATYPARGVSVNGLLGSQVGQALPDGIARIL